MKRTAFLLAAILAMAAVPAAADTVRAELGREILRRIPEWPQAQVEIPIEVYEEFVRESMLGPAPPQPPETAWIERAAWTVRLGIIDATVEAALDVLSLPGAGPRSVPVLPAAIVWSDVSVGGRPAALRPGKDGWFLLDVRDAGRVRVTAKAVLPPQAVGEGWRIAWATPPAAWSTASAESAEVWEARFSRSALPILGAREGTRGTVGLVPGERLEVTWQRPRPAVRHAARIESHAEIGWTLADGVHQVRAALDLRLWGGDCEEFTVGLPPGADRVGITGPDVREVQAAAGAARVFLRGPVTQRTRLAISFESPRPKTGRMSLPAFGVQGASNRGGTLAVAGGAGAVLLEMDSPGLAPMALHDLPPSVRGLLAAPPVYAYQLAAGSWNAQVDLVDMAEFPVRETLIDSALYTVLYRPDGKTMVKVLYEVRNRGQQYMKVDLPLGAELLVARVAEREKGMARGPAGAIYVPLEKSVLTTAGLISFPVELVYVMSGPALARQGQLRVALPRADLPVAYARCALAVPEGVQVRQWRGVLRQVGAWSSETAEREFQYGTGHSLLPPKVELPDERLAAQTLTLQGKNFYRAGVDYYNRGDYARAQGFFSKVLEVAPSSGEAENAKKYLGNVSIALGKDGAAEKGDRGARAAAKAVQLAQQSGNVAIVEQQKELLQQAETSLKSGDEAQAEAAYKVAVNLSGKLQTRGEVAQEQEAVVRKAREFLGRREAERKEEAGQLADLQKQVQSLKRSITEKGGEQAAQVIEDLVQEDKQRTISGVAPGVGVGAVPGTAAQGPANAQAARQAAPQIELGEALAEQQATLKGVKMPAGGRAGGGRSAGYFAFEDTGDQVQHLKQQVEELKAIRSDLDFEKRAKASVPAAGVESLAILQGSTSSLGTKVAEKARDLSADARKVQELAEQGRIAEAQALIENLEKVQAATARAAQTLTKSGSAQLDIGGLARGGAATVAGAPAAPRGAPEAATRTGERLSGEFKPQPPAASELQALSEAEQNLAKAREALHKKAQELRQVQFGLDDLAAGEGERRRLAEFVQSNYGWAMGRSVVVNRFTALRGPNTYSGGTTVNAGGLALQNGGTFDVSSGATVQVTDGNLVVANDPAALRQVQVVLDRLRANLGQRVAVGSRNVIVNGRLAQAAGIRWTDGANGVRYAVVNEGQLLSLMDIAERRPPAARPPAPEGDVRQEAVVGTQAVIANGGAVEIARAADDSNTLSYNGNALPVAHDDYLLLDNGTYVTAVKSGRMRHWAAEVEPVRFPGVPAAVAVPVVGRTFKFEKTLLDASDPVEIVMDYSWQGEER